MRTTPAKNRDWAAFSPDKLNLSTGPVTVLLPLRGNSLIGTPGHPFHDPEADQALFDALRSNLRTDISIVELDNAINDPPFAEACTRELLKNLAVGKQPIPRSLDPPRHIEFILQHPGLRRNRQGVSPLNVLLPGGRTTGDGEGSNANSHL